jgi:hypothetical protein
LVFVLLVVLFGANQVLRSDQVVQRNPVILNNQACISAIIIQDIVRSYTSFDADSKTAGPAAGNDPGAKLLLMASRAYGRGHRKFALPRPGCKPGAGQVQC